MTFSFFPVSMFTLLCEYACASVIVLGAGIWLHRGKRISKPALALVLLPSILYLLLFYSLQVHMYYSLGGWPTTIGETGFSQALKTHASLTIHCFTEFWCIIMFLWPVFLIIFTAIRRLRPYLLYVGAFAVGYFVSFALIYVSPPGFQYWWWD